MAGLVTDIVSGGPAGGLTVEVPGSGTVSTNGSGEYSLSAARSGVAKLMIRGSGYHPRETYVAFDGSGQANASVIPDGGGFDLTFFDYLFRDNGAGHTHRWTQEPTFELWTRRFLCQEAEAAGVCRTAVAVEEGAGSAFEGLVRAVVSGEVGSLTGHTLHGTAFTTRDHTPGTTVNLNQQASNGVVTIALIESDFSASSWAVWRADAAAHHIVSGTIQIHTSDENRRCVVSHEVAHTLGYDHPGGKPGRASVMGCDGPTAADQLHGRILYARPPGSRSPDTDPDGFTLNSQARFAAGGGATERRIAR